MPPLLEVLVPWAYAVGMTNVTKELHDVHALQGVHVSIVLYFREPKFSCHSRAQIDDQILKINLNKFIWLRPNTK